MTDIVERLRQAPRQPDCPHGLRPKSCKDCDIAELEAEIDRLRAALEEIARPYAADHNRLLHSERQIADIVRAALEAKDA